VQFLNGPATVTGKRLRKTATPA